MIDLCHNVERRSNGDCGCIFDKCKLKELTNDSKLDDTVA